jgi:ElaB/YqjD/DUF883 family membrane-anchored ribosome-binding protein
MPTVAEAARTTEPCRWPTIESVEENLRQARQAVNTARHAAETAIGEATQDIRLHPLRAVGRAAMVGVLAGALVGFGAGWFARKRC